MDTDNVRPVQVFRGAAFMPLQRPRAYQRSNLNSASPLHSHAMRPEGRAPVCSSARCSSVRWRLEADSSCRLWTCGAIERQICLKTGSAGGRARCKFALRGRVGLLNVRACCAQPTRRRQRFSVRRLLPARTLTPRTARSRRFCLANAAPACQQTRKSTSLYGERSENAG